nr:hypothetical protein [Dietzia sp. WMMA184]
MSWGNLIPRVMVEVHLRDRVTGHDLLVVNTHLDPLSGRSRLRAPVPSWRWWPHGACRPS